MEIQLEKAPRVQEDATGCTVVENDASTMEVQLEEAPLVHESTQEQSSVAATTNPTTLIIVTSSVLLGIFALLCVIFSVSLNPPRKGTDKVLSYPSSHSVSV